MFDNTDEAVEYLKDLAASVDPTAIGLAPTKINDPINHPSHYTHYKGVEVIDLTEQMNFNRGNAVKYIARAGLKNPEKEIEDLQKARWYVDREISRLEGLKENS